MLSRNGAARLGNAVSCLIQTQTAPARAESDEDMCAITSYVNTSVHHHGKPPRPNSALRALVGGRLLRDSAYGISTATAAAVVIGVSRPQLDAATIVLGANDEFLVAAVLSCRETLAHATARLRNRVRLIKAFETASPADRAALGRAVSTASSRPRSKRRPVPASGRGRHTSSRTPQRCAMGKRTIQDFERIPRDLYPTPFEATLPLVQHLQRYGAKEFVEPCCGPERKLVQHLESHGLSCLYSSDIIFGDNALQLTKAMCRGANVISNLPFKYPDIPDKTKLMRDLIQHFLDIDVPAWLLTPHDFTTNEYAASPLKRCSDIIVVGRVQWFPGTESTGMDNSVWCRFDARHRGVTAFHNDRSKATRAKRAARALLTKEAAE